MHRIQACARISDTPDELRSFYKECLSVATIDMRNKPKELETVTTYITACLQRLESEPVAFNELRHPPIFSMPDGLLAQANKKEITLIG